MNFPRGFCRNSHGASPGLQSGPVRNPQISRLPQLRVPAPTNAPGYASILFAGCFLTGFPGAALQAHAAATMGNHPLRSVKPSRHKRWKRCSIKPGSSRGSRIVVKSRRCTFMQSVLICTFSSFIPVNIHLTYRFYRCIEVCTFMPLETLIHKRSKSSQ